jgi:hypothetical protein
MVIQPDADLESDLRAWASGSGTDGSDATDLSGSPA